MSADRSRRITPERFEELLGEPQMVDDPRINARQAAILLGIGQRTVHRLIEHGVLPKRGPPGNKRPLLLSDIEELLGRDTS